MARRTSGRLSRRCVQEIELRAANRPPLCIKCPFVRPYFPRGRESISIYKSKSCGYAQAEFEGACFSAARRGISCTLIGCLPHEGQFHALSYTVCRAEGRVAPAVVLSRAAASGPLDVWGAGAVRSAVYPAKINPLCRRQASPPWHASVIRPRRLRSSAWT